MAATVIPVIRAARQERTFVPEYFVPPFFATLEHVTYRPVHDYLRRMSDLGYVLVRVTVGRDRGRRYTWRFDPSARDRHLNARAA